MLPLIYVHSLWIQLLERKPNTCMLYWQLKNPQMALLLVTRFSKVTTLGKTEQNKVWSSLSLHNDCIPGNAV